MMKRGGMVVRIVIVGLMMIGMATSTCATQFGNCYTSCFSLCLLNLDSPVTCSVKCIPNCVKSASAAAAALESASASPHNHSTPNPLHSSKLDCAFKFCSNISTKQNPGITLFTFLFWLWGQFVLYGFSIRFL